MATLAGAVLALLAWGAVAGDVDELRALVESGQHAEAHELGRTLQYEHEGDPQFDFHFGLAAIEMGAFSEGIFAMERVLMRHPGSQRSRLELARAYFLMEENSQARREFERVLAQDPPAQVRATIERYLITIQRRESRFDPIYSYWVEGGFGYDSNVNSAPGDEVQIGPFVLELEDEDDFFVDLRAGGDVITPINENLAWFARGRFSNRTHLDESDFDNRRLRVDGGIQWMDGPLQVRGSLDLQRYWMDGDVYQNQTGLQGSGRYRLNPQQDVNGFLRLSRFSYPEQESRDSTMWMLGGGFSQRVTMPMQPLLHGSLFLGNEDPRRSGPVARARADRQLIGIQVGGQITVLPEVTARGSLQFMDSRYAEGELGMDAREEQMLALELAADWRPLAQITVTPTLNFSDNSANEDIYEYQRAQLSVRVRYTFD